MTSTIALEYFTMCAATAVCNWLPRPVTRVWLFGALIQGGYDLSGQLKTTPNIGGMGIHEVAGFDCADHA